MGHKSYLLLSNNRELQRKEREKVKERGKITLIVSLSLDTPSSYLMWKSELKFYS